MKINRQIFIIPFLFFSCLCFSSEQVENLQTQINIFLEQHSKKLADKGYRSDYKIGNIDPRLSLHACSEELNFIFNRPPLEQNNITILTECKGIKPWKLYVSVKYNIYGHIITASETIQRGTLINRSMLQEKEEIINKGRHISFSDMNKIIGMQAKRTIRNNAIISRNQLIAPKLIKRGDNVIITAANNAISVRMNGTALTDGALGEQISIRNKQSKRIIKGRVTEMGHVLVAI